MKRKGKKKAQAERVTMERPKIESKQSAKSVWNIYPGASYKAEEISLDEYVKFMEMFLNKLYPTPGFRVTAMTYMKDAIYMKITKDLHTQTENARVTI